MKTNLKRRLSKHGRAGRAAIGSVVKAALADDVLRMLSFEPGARQARPEHVHQFRTSVRRLRSDLRFFGPSLDDSVSGPIRDDLKWLAGLLGRVRDLDVLEARLREQVVALEIVSPSDPIFEGIDLLRTDYRTDLLEELDGDRFASIRDAIIAEAREPTLTDPELGADRPAGPIMADRLSKDWERFLDDLRSNPADTPVESLHEFRKRAKRTRYAAEAAATLLGGRASRTSRRIGRTAKQVQEVLGESQDAVVAVSFLEEFFLGLHTVPEPTRDAARLLITRQHTEADDVLNRYRSLRDEILDDD